MFEFSGHRMDVNGRLSRRCLLRAGVMGLTGLSLVDLARAGAGPSRKGDDLSVILVWLDGGPPNTKHTIRSPRPRRRFGDPMARGGRAGRVSLSPRCCRATRL